MRHKNTTTSMHYFLHKILLVLFLSTACCLNRIKSICLTQPMDENFAGLGWVKILNLEFTLIDVWHINVNLCAIDCINNTYLNIAVAALFSLPCNYNKQHNDLFSHGNRKPIRFARADDSLMSWKCIDK